MPGATFDPKAYVEGPDNSAFDPAAYISDQPKGPSTSAGMSALEHFGNAASLGYLPHLQALASQLTPNPNANVDQMLRARGTKIIEPRSTYLSERDANIQRLQQEAQEHPYASAAGAVGGAIAGGGALSGLTPINAATGFSRIAQAAKGGALVGALSNPGDTEGQVAEGLQVRDRAWNAAKGAGLGAAGQGVVEGVASGAKAVTNLPNSLQNKAEERAFKAAGAMLKDYRKAASQYEIDGIGLGEHLIDSGIAKPGLTEQDVAQAVRDYRGAASQGQARSLGQYLIEKGVVNPNMNAKGLSKAIGEFQQNRINAMGRYMLDNGLIKPGMTVDDIAKAAEDLHTEHGQLIGNTLAKLDQAGAAAPSHEEIAKAIEAQSLPMKNLKTASPTYNALQDLAGDIRTLGKGAEGTFKGAQDIKEFIRDQVEKTGGFSPLNPTEKNLALRHAYSMVSDKLEKAAATAAQASGDDKLLSNYLAAKSGYRNTGDIAKIANDQALRQNANRFFSPTDYMSGLGGAAIGAMTGGDTIEDKLKHAAMGAGLGLANKAARTYGTPLVSMGLDRAGAALARTPLGSIGQAAAPMLNAAERSPLAISATEGAMSRPSLNAAPVRNVASPPQSQPQQPISREDSWAARGIQNLGIQDQALAQKLLQNPKTKQLLIQASDYPPGSKVLTNIMNKLQKGYGSAPVQSYADGGMVDDPKKKSLGQIIGYPDSNPEPEKKAPSNPPPPAKPKEEEKGETFGHRIGYPGMKSGGMVPGRAPYPGNNKKNDVVTAKLSPGEVVIPRSVMESKDPATGAKEFVADVMKQKAGEDKWASQGIQNLGIEDEDLAQRLLQDPKGKRLLVQASDLPPGSKALKNVMNQIQKGWG